MTDHNLGHGTVASEKRIAARGDRNPWNLAQEIAHLELRKPPGYTYVSAALREEIETLEPVERINQLVEEAANAISKT